MNRISRTSARNAIANVDVRDTVADRENDASAAIADRLG
jgi:hypothetical protein